MQKYPPAVVAVVVVVVVVGRFIHCLGNFA